MSKPSISTIIPTIKQTGYLIDTLESLKVQTLLPNEVVIFCNGWTPARDDVLKWSAIINIRLHTTEEQLTIGDSWNFCMQLAKFEWVHLLHDDDWLDPEFYREFVCDFTDSAKFATWFCASRVWHDNCPERDYTTSFSKVGILNRLDSAKEIFETKTRCAGFISKKNSSVMNMGYDTSLKFHLDVDYQWRTAAHTASFFNPNALAHYRLHSNSISAFQAISGQNHLLDSGVLVDDAAKMLVKYIDEDLLGRPVILFLVRSFYSMLRYYLRRGMVKNAFFSLYCLCKSLRYWQE